MVRSEKKSSTLVIVVSWIVVLIPLGWGVVQSVVKSLPLFQMPAAFETDVMGGSCSPTQSAGSSSEARSVARR